MSASASFTKEESRQKARNIVRSVWDESVDSNGFLNESVYAAKLIDKIQDCLLLASEREIELKEALEKIGQEYVHRHVGDVVDIAKETLAKLYGSSK